jgi:ATP-dependent RNA helicase HelY
MTTLRPWPADTDLRAYFEAQYPFALDPFQREALDALEAGHSVLVSAPTGTGKTVVAEYGVLRALAQGRRAMYTTPIKALSNQKYRDFRRQYGDLVGLLTGDIVENPEGRLLIMTTEVLRNMLLQRPQDLDDVACVVFDEIHYLADPERGTTWEEAILCCPPHVQLVCLSATVANAEELAAWISTVHRPVRLITHHERAVPLEHFVYLDGQLYRAVDAQGRVVLKLGKVARALDRQASRLNGRRGGAPPATPVEIVRALRRQKLLPAIYFLFSRRDTELAAESCARLRLTTPAQSREIQALVEERLAQLSPEDRALGQVATLAALLPLGVAFHHAGLLPVLKVLVEELFNAGLLGVVFATDTLALGINMPAKTVVIGEVTKFDGESRRLLLPNEYQQLTGRAGRRGMDERGVAVIPYSPWVPLEEALAIATAPILPVLSGFTLRYNTVLNLWPADGRPLDLERPATGERLVYLLTNSFREFQTDGRLRALQAEIAALESELAALPADTATWEAQLRAYRAQERALEKARREAQRLRQEEQALLATVTEPVWPQPEKHEIRERLRGFSGGEAVYLADHGWGIYLGRPSLDQVALVLVGTRVLTLDRYTAIAYLPPAVPRVDLPAALQSLSGPVEDVRTLLTAEEWAALQQAIAALALPDLAAWAAEVQAERRAALEPRLANLRERLAQVEARIADLEAALRANPCFPSRARQQAQLLVHRAERLRQRLFERRQELAELQETKRTHIRQTLRSLQRVLQALGYLQDGRLTAKARWLCDLFDPNGLILCELIERRSLEALAPAELVEVLSWFAYDRDSTFINRASLSPALVALRDEIMAIQREVLRCERQHGLDLTPGLTFSFYGLAYAWCQGASFADLLDLAALPEGDLILTFNKTLDLMRQLRDMLRRNWPDSPLLAKLAAGERLMRRGLVALCCRAGLNGVESQPEAFPVA